MFNEGISKAGSLLDIAVDLQVIDKKGTWFSYKDKKLGQGRRPSVKKRLLKDYHQLSDSDSYSEDVRDFLLRNPTDGK